MFPSTILERILNGERAAALAINLLPPPRAPQLSRRLRPQINGPYQRKRPQCANDFARLETAARRRDARARRRALQYVKGLGGYHSLLPPEQRLRWATEAMEAMAQSYGISAHENRL